MHPRTPGDILLRTAAIHIFSACAYAHLCALLGWRKPHGAILSPLLVLAFILLPELVLLQLGFWALPAILVKPWRDLTLKRIAQLPQELGINKKWMTIHFMFTLLNTLPLVTTFLGYRKRLGMRYRAAIYVANLGFDHRNGWLAIGALVSIGFSLLLLAVLALGLSRSTKGVDVERSRPDKDLLENSSEFDWSSFTEVIYAALIHQVLLGKTNHPVLVIEYFKAWPLLLLTPVIVWFAYKRRGIRYETIIRACCLVFISATVIIQLAADFWELYDVAHNRVQPWNYRWKVKDYFSSSHLSE